MSIIFRSSSVKKGRVSRRATIYNRTGKSGFFRSMFAFAGFWVRVGLGIVVMGCVSIGMLYAYRYVTVQPFFALKHVIVSGNSHRDDAGLIAESQVCVGQNVFETSIKNIQRRLQNDPWIAEASVRRILPDRVEIHVQERQACFWIKKDQELYYADRQGRIIDKVGPEKFISLPVLCLSRPASDSAMVLDRIVSLVDSKILPFGFASISCLSLRGDDVMEIFLESPRRKVVIGLRDMNRNCRQLSLVWDDLRHRDEIKDVRVLQAFAGKAWAGFG